MFFNGMIGQGNPQGGVGEQHRCQSDGVCNLVIEQPDHWLEDEIRAELMVHYGAAAYASSTDVCHCECSGQMTDRTLPVMFENVDEVF
jgi:hypothetical protein